MSLSKYDYVRTVHHIRHIYMVYTLCGHGHDSSNYHLLRIVHHRYHICMVSPLCGHGHVSLNYHFVRIVHHRYHIYMVSPRVDADVCLQITTLWELCTTGGIAFERFFPCMDMDMVLQITTFRELCSTRITFVWFMQCGYRHGSSNYHFVRIVHHRYHICMVSHQYGCGHAAIRLDCVKNVYQKCHIWIVSQ